MKLSEFERGYLTAFTTPLFLVVLQIRTMIPRHGSQRLAGEGLL